MARGWESKSVEQQQEKTAERKNSKPLLSPEQKERERKVRGLELSRERLRQQFEAAQSPVHREMLQKALAEIDRQIALYQ